MKPRPLILFTHCHVTLHFIANFPCDYLSLHNSGQVVHVQPFAILGYPQIWELLCFWKVPRSTKLSPLHAVRSLTPKPEPDCSSHHLSSPVFSFTWVRSRRFGTVARVIYDNWLLHDVSIGIHSNSFIKRLQHFS